MRRDAESWLDFWKTGYYVGDHNMTFEEYIDLVNNNVFLKEFTFHNTKFRPTPEVEVELADYIVYVSDRILVFQAKEREEECRTADLGAELRWLDNKVVRKATRQLRHSIEYLQRHSPITALNNRNHEFSISHKGRTIHNVVVFDNQTLNDRSDVCKFHNSRTAGFIHILSKPLYTLILDTLSTPAEIFEYLTFREEVLFGYDGVSTTIDEKALIGQYLYGELKNHPNSQYEQYLSRLENDNYDFDLSIILTQYGEKVFYYGKSASVTDYYAILEQFARLNRSYLASIKKRFAYCLEKIRENSSGLPTRLYVPEIPCGFVMMPITQERVDIRLNYLQIITAAAKYDFRMPKQVGICFSLDQEEVLVDWCYIEGPFQTNERIEAMLKDNYPFPKVREEVVNRYRFKA